MSQDTRKDKRAKVVSLNVRYKSATVDEFIEHHSHDVSRGGIFVKTPSPFAPGTLLKFEIRLAGDKSVIAGVGRVVWKRESAQAAAEKPAGMGVKFIKIDDASRALIDRLVNEKADAGSAFTSEPAANEAAPAGSNVGAGTPPPAPVAEAKPGSDAAKPGIATAGAVGAKPEPPRTGLGPPPAAKRNATVIGVGPARPTTDAPAAVQPAAEASKAPEPTAAQPAQPASGPSGSSPPRPQNVRRATMIGVGNPAAEIEAKIAREKAAQNPVAAVPMFPVGAESEPVNEPTVMKQAAELLEEALREAGGSLDEIGQTPLFSKDASKEIGASGAPGPVAAAPAVSVGPSATPTLVGATSTPEPAPVSASAEERVVSAVAAAKAPDAVEASPSPPRASRPDVSEASAPTAPMATGSRRLSDDLEPVKKKSGGGFVFAALVLLLLAGGGAYAWKTGLLASVLHGPPPPAPTPEPSASITAEPTPPVVDSGAVGTEAADASHDAEATAALAVADAGIKDAGSSDASADASTDASTADSGAAAAHPAKPAPRRRAPHRPSAPATGTPSDSESTPSEPEPAPAPAPEPAPAEPAPSSTE